MKSKITCSANTCRNICRCSIDVLQRMLGTAALSNGKRLPQIRRKSLVWVYKSHMADFSKLAIWITFSQSVHSIDLILLLHFHTTIYFCLVFRQAVELVSTIYYALKAIANSEMLDIMDTNYSWSELWIYSQGTPYPWVHWTLSWSCKEDILLPIHHYTDKFRIPSSQMSDTLKYLIRFERLLGSFSLCANPLENIQTCIKNPILIHRQHRQYKIKMWYHLERLLASSDHQPYRRGHRKMSCLNTVLMHPLTFNNTILQYEISA